MHKSTEIMPFLLISYTDPSQRDGKGHIIGEFYLIYVNTSRSASAKIEKASKSLRETLGWWNWKEGKNKQARIWDSKGRVPELWPSLGKNFPPYHWSCPSPCHSQSILYSKGTKVTDGWAQSGSSQRQAAPPISAVCKDDLCSADLHSHVICFTVPLQPFVWVSLSPVANRNSPTGEYCVHIYPSLCPFLHLHYQ